MASFTILNIQTSDKTNQLSKTSYLSIVKQNTPTFNQKGHKRFIYFEKTYLMYIVNDKNSDFLLNP